jgi:hypothetical protein
MINACTAAIEVTTRNRKPHCTEHSHAALQRDYVAARDCDAADSMVRVLDWQANSMHGVGESVGFTAEIDSSMGVHKFSCCRSRQ